MKTPCKPPHGKGCENHRNATSISLHHLQWKLHANIHMNMNTSKLPQHHFNISTSLISYSEDTVNFHTNLHVDMNTSKSLQCLAFFFVLFFQCLYYLCLRMNIQWNSWRLTSTRTKWCFRWTESHLLWIMSDRVHETPPTPTPTSFIYWQYFEAWDPTIEHANPCPTQTLASSLVLLLSPVGHSNITIPGIQKNPFKIHKRFTNHSNMAQKSNTKVRNSSAHLVKGHNPYCSWWPTHSISQNWSEVHSSWFCTAKLFLLNDCSVLGNAVSDWLADSFSLALWWPKNSQTFTNPTQFSQTFKALKRVSHFPQTLKDLQRPCKPNRLGLKHLVTYLDWA